MKKKAISNSNTKAQEHHIPDIDILDLENDVNNTENISEGEDDYNEYAESPRRKLPGFINIHTLFFVVIIGIILCIFLKFKNWGVHIDQAEIFKDGQGSYSDTLDQVLPLLDSEGHMIQQDISSIVVFGNAPFADDRDSDDNLAAMIEKRTGATVYNCSISESLLSSQNYAYDPSADPMDAYSFYWLVTLMTTGANSDYYESAANTLGGETPPEADEVYDILTTVNFNDVDCAIIMYDASDYLNGRYMYNDDNSTDITCFTGNLEAGIELLNEYYPNMRIIVMSPTYAYAEVDGEYISSDIYTIGNLDVLSTYVIKEYASASAHGVTFIDNLYGTVTEDNAKEYLSDNLHLNKKGRSLVADRIMYALEYYNKEQ